MRWLPRWIVVSLVALPCALAQDVRARRPNVLWLVLEDTGASELGCYGNRDVATPRIDALAAKGVRFTRASSTSPHPQPARATLYSGRFATSFGGDLEGAGSAPREASALPALLRAAGYFTSHQRSSDTPLVIDSAPLEPGTDALLMAPWCAHGRGATYALDARAERQPFFSVFETNITSSDRLRVLDVERPRARRAQRSITPPPADALRRLQPCSLFSSAS